MAIWRVIGRAQNKINRWVLKGTIHQTALSICSKTRVSAMLSPLTGQILGT